MLIFNLNNILLINFDCGENFGLQRRLKKSPQANTVYLPSQYHQIQSVPGQEFDVPQTNED